MSNTFCSYVMSIFIANVFDFSVFIGNKVRHYPANAFQAHSFRELEDRLLIWIVTERYFVLSLEEKIKGAFLKQHTLVVGMG